MSDEAVNWVTLRSGERYTWTWGHDDDGVSAQVHLSDETRDEGEAWATFTAVELAGFLIAGHAVLSAMDWHAATYLWARPTTGGAEHLLVKAEFPRGKTLCGRNPPDRWSDVKKRSVPSDEWDRLDVRPLLGTPLPRAKSLLDVGVCERCRRAWTRREGQTR